MGANLGTIEAYKGDWKKELRGIDYDVFAKNWEKGIYDELYNGDKEFADAVMSKSLFEKPSDEEAKKEEAKPSSEPGAKPEGAKDPWWKTEGYSSEEEFLEKFRGLKTTYAEQKEKLDRLNAERGRDGNEAKQYKLKLSEREKELEDLRKKVSEFQGERARQGIALPPPPKFGSLSEDLDEELKTSLSSYNSELETYHNGMSKVVGTMAERMQKLEDELQKAGSKVGELDTFYKTRAQREQEEQFDKNLKAIYEQASKLQEKYPELKTTRSFSEIDKDVSGYKNEAKDRLPKDEFEKHSIIMDAIYMMKPVEERDGQKIVRIDLPNRDLFDDLEDAYILLLKKKGKLNEMLNRKTVEAERDGQKAVLNAQADKQNGAVVVPDSESIGSNIEESLDKEGMAKEMQRLLAEAKGRQLTPDEDKKLSVYNKALFGPQRS